MRYRVVDGGEFPGGRARLDRVMAGALPEHLARASFPSNDGGVWLIKRLDTHAAASAVASPDHIARAIAAATVRAVDRTIEHGANGETVLWFPDRAAFLTRFLLDCVHGRAAGRWEYREFDVATASASATIRAIAAGEPDAALAMFVRANRTDGRALLDALLPADADAVVEALARGAAARDSFDPLPSVEAFRRLVDGVALPTDPRRAGLAIFVESVRTHPERATIGAARAARDLAHVAAAMFERPIDEAVQFASALASNAWAAAAPGAMASVLGIVSWPPAARADAVQAILETRRGRGDDDRDATRERVTTYLGGMFLLFPLLDEFVWWSATATWPPLERAAGERVDSATLVQYLAVIGALGADANVGAARDPLLRRALGLPSDLDAGAISVWSTGVDPDLVSGALEVFIAGLRRLRKIAGIVTLAPLREGVIAVDRERGVWLATAPAAPSSIRALVEFLDRALGKPVEVAGTTAWIDACLAPARAPEPPVDERLLTRLDRQADSATVGTPFDLAPAVREFVMLAAQALSRELAWRLPGFARSSLPYLVENLLAFDATAEFGDRETVVSIGDPPLHHLVSLTGMNRRRFRLPATGDRTWVLTQAH